MTAVFVAGITHQGIPMLSSSVWNSISPSEGRRTSGTKSTQLGAASSVTDVYKCIYLEHCLPYLICTPT